MFQEQPSSIFITSTCSRALSGLLAALSDPEVYGEVCHLVLCFLLGVVGLVVLRGPLQVLRRIQYEAAHKQAACCAHEEQSCSDDHEEEHLLCEQTQPRSDIQADTLTRLPRDMVAELATSLPLCDLWALGTADITLSRQFWHNPDVWRALAARENVTLAIPQPHAISLESLGNVLRDAFRQAAFRVDGQRLAQLAQDALACGGQEAVLAEALQVLRGLVPADGIAAAQKLCGAAEKALQLHDPGYATAASAAQRLLEVARRRDGAALGFAGLDRWEAAYSSAVELTALLDATEYHFEEELAQAASEQRAVARRERRVDAGLPASGSTTPPSAWDESRQAQHLEDLDALLSELQSQMDHERSAMMEAERWLQLLDPTSVGPTA